jgi:ATP-dependent Clp protease ATP-binding subunit ClpC
MFERFTERGRQVVVLAQEEARTANCGYVGVEHILLALLREEEGLAARVLNSLDVTVEKARASAERRYTGSGEPREDGKLLPFTPRTQKVLEMALREALSLGHNYIGTEHVLLSLVREHDNVGVEILRDDFDADPEKVKNEVIRVLSGPKAPILKKDKESRPGTLTNGMPIPFNEARSLMALAVKLGRQHPEHPVEKIINAAIALNG